MHQKQIYENDTEKEKAVLALVLLDDVHWETEDIIAELEELSTTAGLAVVGHLIQNRLRPDPAYYLGKGKLAELQELCQQKEADCVVFEKALSPSQLNNLANFLQCKVIDKTALILDIFAQRARSREGKLQVALAQANYLLPRLMGQGISLSRQGGASKGGVGTRGPGETKLEMDRRNIRQRIQVIQQELEEVKKQRSVQQKSKLKNQLPLLALVGYTNAGKSSLLNCLTDDHIYAEDQLFATLDTTTRSFYLPNGSKCLITDTVGFIHDLPHTLIDAFQATLDELYYADLLLHVIDISNPNFINQLHTVEAILEQLGVKEKKHLFVFNKIDKLEHLPPVALHIEPELCCYISAKKELHIDQLLMKIQEQLMRNAIIQIHLPVTAGQLLHQAYDIGRVSDLQYTENAICFQLLANEKDIPQELWQYQVLEK